MRKQPFFEISVFLLLLFVGSLPGFGQRTVVVVRHADKLDDTDDAVLSPTGEDQAKRLAHLTSTNDAVDLSRVRDFGQRG